MTINGYRLLEEWDVQCHAQGLGQYYPQAELVEHEGRVGWILAVMTARGNVYDIYIPYPLSYPDQEPRAWLDPPPQRAGNPHLYADGSICVHGDPLWSNEKYDWTPTVGFTSVRAWLELYEDWLYDRRPWPARAIPQDIHDRL